jgi:hypothetical protein
MNQTVKVPWQYLVAIFVTGLCIGFLVGLSASPVVNALIAGIVSLAAGVVGALCGVRLEKGEPKDSPAGSSAVSAQVSPVPIPFLIVSIVLGSLLGLQARTQEWFAESPEHLAKKWQKSTGLSEQDIAKRLFNSIYGGGKGEAKSEEDKSSEAQPIAAGVLFAVSADQCERLRHYLDNPDRSRLQLEGLGYANIKEFATKCKENEDLTLAFNLLICPEKDHH